MRTALILSAAVLLVACGDKKNDDLEGLPAASDWQEQGMAGPPPGGAQGGMANPHGGAANPHAGMDMNNPHAGMDMGGGSSVENLGLPPPDPNKPIDPNKYLRGIITAADPVKDRVTSGSTLFLMVRKAGPDGKATGAPIAVDIKTITSLPAAFSLDGANAMIGGTGFEGKVVVAARLDQDGDAGTKQPGDVEGEVKAAIPADSLVLTLDTVRQ